jgi:ribose transport system substrate-binding protein
LKKGRFVLLGVLVGVLAFVAAGCGGDDDEAAGTAADTAAATDGGTAGAAEVTLSDFCGSDCQAALKLEADPASINCTVGLSWNSFLHPYGATTGERTKEAQKELFPNMKLIVSDGRGDSTTQTNGIDDMLNKSIDVLIISPNDAAALAPAVKRAEDKGVKVIASDRSVDAPVETYIGAANVDTGKVAGDYIVELLGGKGSVVELQGSLGASPTIDRHKGFEDAIKGSPDIKVVGSQTANYNREQGRKVMEDFLQKFGSGQIDAVFTHNDEMSLGAIQAIKEAGRGDEIKVVGIDGQESALKAIKAGDYAGSVVYPIDVPEHLVAAAKLCADETMPERIKMTATLVTKDNVGDVEGKTF